MSNHINCKYIIVNDVDGIIYAEADNIDEAKEAVS